MVKGGRQSSCVAGQHSREQRENNVPAGTLALVRSPLALRCSREQNALHTLIRHRHLTPSCGGPVPTAERTLDPARMFMESLTTGPELENSQGHFRPIRPVWPAGSCLLRPESGPEAARRWFGGALFATPKATRKWRQ